MNGKKIFKMAKKDETVKFKIYIRKIKSPFIIYADFESILVPENNGNQNSDQSYMNKYQNHLGWSVGYKLVYSDDQCSKYFKLYLDQIAVRKFITNMVKRTIYSSRMIKEHFNKEFVATNEDDENFESSTKC